MGPSCGHERFWAQGAWPLGLAPWALGPSHGGCGPIIFGVALLSLVCTGGWAWSLSLCGVYVRLEVQEIINLTLQLIGLVKSCVKS